MVSLRKYLLATDRTQGGDRYGRIVALLLEGIASHAISYDDAKHSSFQQDIRRLGEQLLEGKEGQGDMALAGQILRTFEQYSSSVRQQFMAAAELREMAAILTDALRQSCRGNQRTVSSLAEIERHLRGASQMADPHTLRAKLEDCVNTLHSEVQRQVVESANTKELLKAASSKPAAIAMAEEQGEDPVTGLLDKRQGRKCLDTARTAGTPQFAAVLALERWNTVVQRFGPEAGESYLLEASQKIAQNVKAGDQLFRWSGPSFLTVMDRPGPFIAIQSEIARIAGGRTEYTIATRDRAVLIPVSVATLCIAISEPPSTDAVVEQADSFVVKMTGWNMSTAQTATA